VVIGGENSYNFGRYEDSLFETLLPVNIGTGGRKEGDINTVLCIDVSGSTGKAFSQAGAKKVDVEKAQALSMLKDFKPTDNVGVIAFNVNAFLLSGVSPLESKYEEVANKILTLQDGGGTVISTALASAAELLINVEGSKNIVIISDGKTKHLQETFRTAEKIADMGIRIYTVGIGKDTHVSNMQEIANIGRGSYFEPEQSQRLRILFGRPPETEEGMPMQYYPIVPVDNAHFITKNLEINATIGGYNQVVPKSAAQHLVSTIDGSPVLVVWRFGLGKVVTIATDDGGKYAGPLLRPDNSQLISRSINWAVGDLARRSAYFVDAQDTYMDRPVEISVKSQSVPSDPKIELSKIDKDLYSGVYYPDKTGFIDILGTTIAVNYNSEYADVGVNSALRDAVKSTGGQMLDPDAVDKIVELIKVNSRRIKTENVFYTWAFVLAALILFLIDVCIRRLNENRRIKS
ncbi:VWA domain-containing protein, partial [Candidatus Woesearchaeota archaeon]|nr:VWA domain-containing protein [Candidatus Woesearchaeota archaeon]